MCLYCKYLRYADLVVDVHSICCTKMLYCLAAAIFPQVMVMVAVSPVSAPTSTYTENRHNVKHNSRDWGRILIMWHVGFTRVCVKP